MVDLCSLWKNSQATVFSKLAPAVQKVHFFETYRFTCINAGMSAEIIKQRRKGRNDSETNK